MTKTRDDVPDDCELFQEDVMGTIDECYIDCKIAHRCDFFKKMQEALHTA